MTSPLDPKLKAGPSQASDGRAEPRRLRLDDKLDDEAFEHLQHYHEMTIPPNVRRQFLAAPLPHETLELPAPVPSTVPPSRRRNLIVTVAITVAAAFALTVLALTVRGSASGQSVEGLAAPAARPAEPVGTAAPLVSSPAPAAPPPHPTATPSMSRAAAAASPGDVAARPPTSSPPRHQALPPPRSEAPRKAPVEVHSVEMPPTPAAPVPARNPLNELPPPPSPLE